MFPVERINLYDFLSEDRDYSPDSEARKYKLSSVGSDFRKGTRRLGWLSQSTDLEGLKSDSAQ